jgi:hypothetical protein
VSEHVDAPIDSDPLIEFAIEPEPPRQSVEAAAITEDTPTDPRIDGLEKRLEGVLADLSSLRAEMATLVASVGDINNAGINNSSTKRSGLMSGVAGMCAGLAIAIIGWMTWPGRAADDVGAGSSPVPAVELPLETEAPPVVPAIALASVAEAPLAIERASRPAAAQRSPIEEYVGTLSIDATPVGAQVFIDRRAAGTVPLRVENLRAGSHLVWIERDGYRRWTQVVEVRSNRVSRVSVSLEAITAP